MEWKNFEFLNGMINGIAMLTACPAQFISSITFHFSLRMRNEIDDWLKWKGSGPIAAFDLLKAKQQSNGAAAVIWRNEISSMKAKPGGGSQPTNHKTNEFMALNEFMIVLLVLLVASGAATHSTFLLFLQLPPQSINKINWVAVAEEMKKLVEWYYNSK